jgi:type IV/VI secretion system ImpK/VasF family protein
MTTLLELCEPLFQCVCRLNRSARKGGNDECAQVRSEIEAIFKDMRARAATEPELKDQYGKIELVLIFFVDSMLSENHANYSTQWHRNRMAYQQDPPHMAGDEDFFHFLEETLKERSPAADERLAIFYTCMGLGFSGFYTGQPVKLREKLLECQNRIQDKLDKLNSDQCYPKLCYPEAYVVDRRKLGEPPGRKLLGIAIALIGLIVVLLLANGYFFNSASEDLVQALKNINNAPQEK